MENFNIIKTSPETVTQYGLCGYKDIHKPGYFEKLNWYKEYIDKGLVIKVLYSDEAGTQGMLEYIDGQYCWRPVSADNYLFIQCLFVGFKKQYKNLGLASQLIEDCYNDAKKQQKSGLAVLVRKGAFMAKADVFLKNGFEVVAKVNPDFQLFQKKINPNALDVGLIDNSELLQSKYSKGLYILRADQCPYTVKNVQEITEAAKHELGIEPIVMDINSPIEAQQNPSPFGTFALILNGKILSHHPVSKTRFLNILRKEI